MPSFFVYAPDRADHLAKRLAVRPEHLERAQKDLDSGMQEFGRPFLPPPDAKPHGLTLPPGVPNIGGSFMIWTMASREAVWDRLREDVYWRADIWDKERIIVEEFCP